METPDRRSERASGVPKNALARFVGLSIAGRIGSLMAGFVASIVLARILGPADRGLLGLMIAANALGVTCLTIGVPLAVMYFASLRDADQPALLGNSFLQAEVLTLIAVPAAAVGYKVLADALGAGHGARTWILVAGLVPITFLDYTTHAQLQGLLHFGRSSLLIVVSRLAYLLGVLILVGVIGWGVAGGVVATALGSIVSVLISLPPLTRYGLPRVDFSLFRRTVAYGAKVQLGALFQLANGRFDVIVMQIFRPLSQVGYYVVAQTVAELVTQLAGAFQVSVLPLVAKLEGAEAAQASTSSIRHHGILALVAVAANAVFGPLVILVAYGGRFTQAVTPMLILLPGVWFLGLGLVVQGDLGGRGRPGTSSALAGTAAVLTVALDFVLIPPLGVIGGALASDVAYTTFGVLSLIALERVSGVSMRELTIPTRADFDAYRRVPPIVLRAAAGKLKGLRAGRGERPDEMG